MKKTSSYINPNFYLYSDLSFREYEKSLDYFLKFLKLQDPLNRKLAAILQDKHKIKSLLYESKACRALATSCDVEVRKSLLQSAKIFEKTAAERRNSYRD